MDALFIAFEPIAVSYILALLKKIGLFKITGEYAKVVTRFALAFLSYGIVYLTTSLSGDMIYTADSELFAQAFVTFIGATGTYFFMKPKK